MYKLTQNAEIIQRISDGAFIPTDPENRDYKEFLASGIVPELADPIAESTSLPTVEEQLSALRKAVLTGAKVDLQDIDNAITSAKSAQVSTDVSTPIQR